MPKGPRGEKRSADSVGAAAASLDPGRKGGLECSGGTPSGLSTCRASYCEPPGRMTEQDHVQVGMATQGIRLNVVALSPFIPGLQEHNTVLQ